MYFLRLILIFVVFLNVSCSETVQKNGISNLKINQLKIIPGKTSKENLINKYGPPVFESIFNKNTVYYISQVSSYKNLDNRKTIKLVVYEVTLNEKNIVQRVNKYSENDAANIKISTQKTQDDNNSSIMFFKDIINNLRRRNLDD